MLLGETAHISKDNSYLCKPLAPPYSIVKALISVKHKAESDKLEASNIVTNVKVLRGEYELAR